MTPAGVPAEVVGFTNDVPLEEFIANLTKELDAEVLRLM